MAIMKLNGPQFRMLRLAFTESYTGMEDFKGLIQDLNRPLADVPTGGTLTEAVRAALNLAQSNGWLLEMLRMAGDDNPQENRFALVLRELESQVPAAVLDHFDACRLGGDYVMVDRETLRDAVRSMATPLGKRILLVDGQPRSGKSHAQFLVTYLRQALSQFEVVRVDLERDASLVQGPLHAEHLGGRIASQMRMEPPPPPEDKQRAKWVLKFCDDLQARNLAQPGQWWILIDHFNKVLLPQSAIDLVKELAGRVATTLSDYRLVLISYTEEFGPDVRGWVARDAMKPITTEDLTAFFHRASEQGGTTPDAAMVARAVARVLQRVDLTQPDYLLSLGPEVSQTTTDLLAGTL